MKSFKTILGVLILCAITFGPPALSVGAESASGLVDRGNERFAAGSFDEALSAYEEAGKLMPESGEVLFNQGNAYFRKGDYEKAREAFEGASLRAKDPSLEARSQFNLGNTAFAQAGELLKEDPRKGVDRYGLSIRHYQNALRLDPGLEEAAENIEIARLRLKDILDQLKNREDQAKEHQKQEEKQAEQQSARQDHGDQGEQEARKGQEEQGKQEEQGMQGEQGKQEEQREQGKPGEHGEETEQKGSASREDGQAQSQGLNQAGQPSKPSQSGKEDGEDRKAVAVVRETPEDVLQEEKENRLRFERSRKGSYQPVDKDW